MKPVKRAATKPKPKAKPKRRKAELKTQPTGAAASSFIASIADERTRKDCAVLLRMMREITGEAPRMWGKSIVGFGTFHYVGASGREGDWFITGFSPRKQALTVYIIAGVNRFPELTKALGPHRSGMGCLYLGHLEAIRLPVLKKLIAASVKYTRSRSS